MCSTVRRLGAGPNAPAGAWGLGAGTCTCGAARGCLHAVHGAAEDAPLAVPCVVFLHLRIHNFLGFSGTLVFLVRAVFLVARVFCMTECGNRRRTDARADAFNTHNAYDVTRPRVREPRDFLSRAFAGADGS